MALKGVAETNKSPLMGTNRGQVLIPFRFSTGASDPTDLVIPGYGTVTRTSSTVYVLTIPEIRSAPSSTGTGSVLRFAAQVRIRLGTAEYASSKVFAATSAGNTTLTITFSGAPANGTLVRGLIFATMQS